MQKNLILEKKRFEKLFEKHKAYIQGTIDTLTDMVWKELCITKYLFKGKLVVREKLSEEDSISIHLSNACTVYKCQSHNYIFWAPEKVKEELLKYGIN